MGNYALILKQCLPLQNELLAGRGMRLACEGQFSKLLGHELF